MSKGPSAREHLPPLGDIGAGSRIGRRAGDASLGHQDIGGDIPDADHAKTVLLEDAADPRQQMIVTAAKRRHDAAENADRAPVQPDLRQRRPQQRADEDQVAAALAAEQLCRAAELADRNPVMAEARDPRPDRRRRGARTAPARCRARQANPRPRTAWRRRPRSRRPARKFLKPLKSWLRRSRHQCLLPSSAGRHSARCLPSPMKARISAIAGSSPASGCTAFSRSAKMPGP